MIGLGKDECLESAIVLYNIAAGGDDSLNARQSTQNISDHLMTISCFDHQDSTEDKPLHSTGTGLQLTSNGFILAAYHAIDGLLEEWELYLDENPITQENLVPWLKEFKKKYYVSDAEGTRYPIDPTFVAYNKDFDAAIIKAVMPCDSVEATPFKVSMDGLKPKEEIMLLGHKWGLGFNQYGRVTKLAKKFKLKGKPTPVRDVFYTDAYGIGGFSGGVYLNLEGELTGLHVAGVRIDPDKELSYGCGVQIVNILQVIADAAAGVEQLVDSLEEILES